MLFLIFTKQKQSSISFTTNSFLLTREILLTMLTNEVFQSGLWIQELFPDLCELKVLFPPVLFYAGSLKELIHRCLDISLHGSVLSQALPVNSSCHTVCLISLTLNLISLSSVLWPENSQGNELRQPCLSPIPKGSPYFVA